MLACSSEKRGMCYNLYGARLMYEEDKEGREMRRREVVDVKVKKGD